MGVFYYSRRSVRVHAWRVRQGGVCEPHAGDRGAGELVQLQTHNSLTHAYLRKLGEPLALGL